MTSNASNAVSPWLYFLSGALLPSLGWYFLRSKDSDDADDSDDDEDSQTDVVESTGNSSTWGIQHAPYKMVLVVNTSLGMGKGKIAAQCGHAAVGCFERASKQCPAAVKAWQYTGCAKIALKCTSEEEMEEIAGRALSKDIPVYLVEDAGRTQIAAGSRTVLGIGPAPASVFEGVSDHLKLM